MPSQGDQIKWANFSHSQADEYTKSVSGTEGTNWWVYTSAQADYVYIYTKSVLFRDSHVYVTAYAYDRSLDTPAFVQKYYFSCYASAIGEDSATRYRLWSGNTSTADTQKYQLWKFKIELKAPGSCNSQFTVHLGGPGVLTESDYNTYCKGKYIVSSGNCRNTEYYWYNDSEDDAAAILYFDPTYDTGVQITTTNANRCIAKYW